MPSILWLVWALMGTGHVFVWVGGHAWPVFPLLMAWWMLISDQGCLELLEEVSGSPHSRLPPVLQFLAQNDLAVSGRSLDQVLTAVFLQVVC